MSPLTKILVILVVLLTLVQTAATVVFVNRVNVTEKSYKEAEEQKASADLKNDELRAQIGNNQAAIDKLRLMYQARVDAVGQQYTTLQQKVADLNVKIAEVTSSNSLMSVDNARLTETLKASEDTKNKLADTVTSTRKINDEIAKRNADLQASNADLTTKLETTERDRRFVSEQLVELQGRGTTAPAGSNPGSAAPSTATPAINASIRDVRTIANIPSATITVGTADRVAPGMKFTVIDGSGQFLGFLTVDQAESNEAVGRLTGPRVPDIKPGNQASTQLR